MKTSIAQQRIDGDGQPIKGWSAEQFPAFAYLMPVLQHLGGLESEGVAEIGADYNDDEDDALGIVWANYPYFSKGTGSLRDMYGWVAVDLQSDDYFGMNWDGEEFRIPLSHPQSHEIAAKKLIEHD